MRKIQGKTIFSVLVIALIIAACRGGKDGSTQSSTETGQELFEKQTLGSAAGCKTCHSLESDVVIIGPSLAGVGSRATTRVENQTAEEYLKESILKPDAYLVEGFPSGVMPHYESQLSPEEVDNLVGYLLTLK